MRKQKSSTIRSSLFIAQVVGDPGLDLKLAIHLGYAHKSARLKSDCEFTTPLYENWEARNICALKASNFARGADTPAPIRERSSFYCGELKPYTRDVETANDLLAGLLHTYSGHYSLEYDYNDCPTVRFWTVSIYVESQPHAVAEGTTLPLAIAHAAYVLSNK